MQHAHLHIPAVKNSAYTLMFLAKCKDVEKKHTLQVTMTRLGEAQRPVPAANSVWVPFFRHGVEPLSP